MGVNGSRMIRVSCPLCGAADSAPHLDAACPERPDERFEIERCDACGMLFVNPRPRPEALGVYYPDDYFAYSFAGAQPLNHRLKVRLWRVLGMLPPPERAEADRLRFRVVRGLVGALRSARVAWTLPAPWAGARFLDIGCGAGQHLQFAAELGWDAFGVDFSPQGIAAAQEAGFSAIVGDAGALPLADASFDLISLMHLLEHTPDPVTALRETARLVRPGGAVYVEVPNAAAWSLRRFGAGWTALELPRHLHHFTPQTLQAAADCAGLQVAALCVYGSPWVIESNIARAGLSGPRAALARLQWRLRCALGQGENLAVLLRPR